MDAFGNQLEDGGRELRFRPGLQAQDSPGPDETVLGPGVREGETGRDLDFRSVIGQDDAQIMILPAGEGELRPDPEAGA